VELVWFTEIFILRSICAHHLRGEVHCQSQLIREVVVLTKLLIAIQKQGLGAISPIAVLRWFILPLGWAKCPLRWLDRPL